MTDFRAELQALIDAVENHVSPYPSHENAWDAALDRARAALAQQEPEGLTDEELLSLDQLRDAWNAQADAANGWDELGVDEIVWWAQRQVLARWGRPSTQPVTDGEVGEHVRWLNFEAEQALKAGRYFPAEMLTRAAELLAHHHPQPIPVSERLPGPGDCDAEGRCWLFDPCDHGWWSYRNALPSDDVPKCWTHWLSAHALPLSIPELLP